MPEDAELRQLHLVANADRLNTTVPLVPDIAHRVTDCEKCDENHIIGENVSRDRKTFVSIRTQLLQQ